MNSCIAAISSERQNEPMAKLLSRFSTAIQTSIILMEVVILEVGGALGFDIVHIMS